MNTRLYIRQKGREKDGKATIQVVVRHKNTEMFFSTGVAITPKNFDKENVVKKGIKLASVERENVNVFKQLIDNCLLALQLEGTLKELTPKQLRTKIETAIHGNSAKGIRFSTLAQQFIAKRLGETTRTNYNRTLRIALKALSDKNIAEINTDEASETSKKLQQMGYKSSTISITLGLISSVFNYGIKEEIINRNPFRGVPKPKVETRNRDLTLEELATLRNAKLSGYKEWARDIFFLSFFLCGINTIDLYHLTRKNISTSNRVMYVRRKTGKPYSVKIEPEAAAIIDKYENKDRIIGGNAKFSTFRWKLNKYLIELGVLLLGHPISSYYARHSWATIAYQIGVPESIIAQGLGHNSVHPTTNIYIRRDEAKVDEANRTIIKALEQAAAENAPSNPKKRQENAHDSHNN